MKAAHAAAEMIGGEFKVPEACFIGTTMNQNPRHPFHRASGHRMPDASIRLSCTDHCGSPEFA